MSDIDLNAIVRDLDRIDAEQRNAARRHGRPLIVAWLIDPKRGPWMGGEYYRALRPAALLAREYRFHTCVATTANLLEGETGVWVEPLGPSFNLVRPDILVIRPLDFSQSMEMDGKPFSFADLVDEAQAAGQMIIADLDDDLWAHEDWTPDSRPDDDRYETWCWKSDAWLVSTDRLKYRVETIADMKDIPARSVFVAPNCYDFHGVGAAHEPRWSRTIGNRLFLKGRQSGDLAMYRSLVYPLLEELDLRFVHVGAAPGEPVLFSTHRLVEKAPVIMPQLAQACSDIAVGVICQAPVDYNAAKTETNAFELASMGIPLVAATSHDLYRDIPGAMLPAARAIRERIKHLVEDRDAWEMESARARAWARDLAPKRERQYLDAFLSMANLLVSAQ